MNVAAISRPPIPEKMHTVLPLVTSVNSLTVPVMSVPRRSIPSMRGRAPLTCKTTSDPGRRERALREEVLATISDKHGKPLVSILFNVGPYSNSGTSLMAISALGEHGWHPRPICIDLLDREPGTAMMKAYGALTEFCKRRYPNKKIRILLNNVPLAALRGDIKDGQSFDFTHLHFVVEGEITEQLMNSDDLEHSLKNCIFGSAQNQAWAEDLKTILEGRLRELFPLTDKLTLLSTPHGLSFHSEIPYQELFENPEKLLQMFQAASSSINNLNDIITHNLTESTLFNYPWVKEMVRKSELNRAWDAYVDNFRDYFLEHWSIALRSLQSYFYPEKRNTNFEKSLTSQMLPLLKSGLGAAIGLEIDTQTNAWDLGIYPLLWRGQGGCVECTDRAMFQREPEDSSDIKGLRSWIQSTTDPLDYLFRTGINGLTIQPGPAFDTLKQALKDSFTQTNEFPKQASHSSVY